MVGSLFPSTDAAAGDELVRATDPVGEFYRYDGMRAWMNAMGRRTTKLTPRYHSWYYEHAGDPDGAFLTRVEAYHRGLALHQVERDDDWLLNGIHTHEFKQVNPNFGKPCIPTSSKATAPASAPCPIATAAESCA